MSTEQHVLPIEQRITSAEMTKYEYARILGARTTQLAMNGQVMVELHGETDPLEIAKLEMKQGRIPLFVQRKLPDGSMEKWPVSDLVPYPDLYAGQMTD